MTDISTQTQTTDVASGNSRIINKDITINNDPNVQLLQPTWMNIWKEVLSYVFSAVIAFDFIIAPSTVMILDGIAKANLPTWQPLTLQGGGLFYVAMAAILSVGAYGSFVKSRELIKNLPDMSRP